MQGTQYAHRRSILCRGAFCGSTAQADLRLCWSHIPHCWKSHVALLMFLKLFGPIIVSFTLYFKKYQTKSF